MNSLKTSCQFVQGYAHPQMVDVHLPTTDGRTLILSRYTEPEADQQLLLDRLNLPLPAQPPPRITAALQALIHSSPCSADLCPSG